MNRRNFLKKAGIATAGLSLGPYILPSGRLFASTGTRIANHVVFVLFAGGIRNHESVHKQYLATQAGHVAEGNLMRNMLNGGAPTSEIIHENWSPILGSSLQQQGTLFQELKYNSPYTGHFDGNVTGMTGNYTGGGLMLGFNPSQPTIFEYYRKHSSPSKNAANAWWLANGLGQNPALNHSKHELYGSQYGANFLQSSSIFQNYGQDYLNNIVNLGVDDLTRFHTVNDFLNNSFDKTAGELPGIINTGPDRDLIKQFMKETVDATAADAIDWCLPGGAPTYQLNGDMVNVSYAWQVLNKLQPELMVLNTTSVDACHSSFKDYIENLHKADYAIGWLWDKIQSHPELGGDTILICMPEHGRNNDFNNLVDDMGMRGLDHTGDDSSKTVFALISGPSDKVVQNQVLGSMGSSVGECVDIVPTIAHILGFLDDIPPGMIAGRALTEAFV